jgi:hypothetical protein
MRVGLQPPEESLTGALALEIRAKAEIARFLSSPQIASVTRNSIIRK